MHLHRAQQLYIIPAIHITTYKYDILKSNNINTNNNTNLDFYSFFRAQYKEGIRRGANLFTSLYKLRTRRNINILNNLRNNYSIKTVRL